MPIRHPFVSAVSATSRKGSVVLEAWLGAPGLAYMKDHQVKHCFGWLKNFCSRLHAKTIDSTEISSADLSYSSENSCFKCTFFIL